MYNRIVVTVELWYLIVCVKGRVSRLCALLSNIIPGLALRLPPGLIAHARAQFRLSTHCYHGGFGPSRGPSLVVCRVTPTLYAIGCAIRNNENREAEEK